MLIRSGLLAMAVAAVMVMASAVSGAAPSAVPDAGAPPTSIGTADQASAWLEAHGLEVGPFDEDGASGIAGTRDGLEVRMTLIDDRLVRSDLEYTWDTLVNDRAVREQVIFEWRRDWAAEADPYIRAAFQGLGGSVPDVLKVPIQVPMSDRTYGNDLFDYADITALPSPGREEVESSLYREWVAVRPPEPEVLAASMTAEGCVDGAFPIEIGPGPMDIDYSVTLGEVHGDGSPWLILAIMPTHLFEPTLDVTRDGISLDPVHLAGNAVAIPIGPGTTTFTLEQPYSASFNSHAALVVLLPEGKDRPTEEDLLGAVPASGFGWGTLLYILCRPSAFPMPPAPGPIFG